MNKARYVIIGIALFVYTLAVIAITTMVVVPNPNEDNDTPPVQQDCNCQDNGNAANE